MKNLTLGLGVTLLGGLGLFGCSGDAFDYPDAGDPSPFPMPPRLARLVQDDAGTDAASQPDAAVEASDAGCTLAVDPSPYCQGVCSLADGGMSCGNTSNGACVAAQGFYAECSGPSDCAQGKVCALANVAEVTGTCPPQLGNAGSGVTISCADPSYLSVVKSSRPLCRTASDCTVMDGGSHACVGAAIAGYPALAGEAVGVCE